MDLPKLDSLDFNGRRVILRADMDVALGENGEVKEKYRLESWKPTVDYLLEHSVTQIILVGHLGRPGGSINENLSLKKLVTPISQILGQEVVFEGDGKIVLKENLRFNPGEEKNDPEFVKSLAALGDIYINDDFSVSHREHASIVGLPGVLPHAAGVRFSSEVENLSKVLENPKTPTLTIISGIKEDKVEMAKKMVDVFDKVLVGGRLPEYFGDESLISVRTQNGKFLIANLNQDKEDITLNSIERFNEEVTKAGTIVLAGVLGKYEDEGHRQGTKRVFEAVANSPAFKVAGGGDTIAAIDMFSLKDKFDWISVGGGAMLEFLANKTLVGIEALLR